MNGPCVFSQKGGNQGFDLTYRAAFDGREQAGCLLLNVCMLKCPLCRDTPQSLFRPFAGPWVGCNCK